MVKKYGDHPLGKLTDSELGKVLEYLNSSFSEATKANIVYKTNLKKDKSEVFNNTVSKEINERKDTHP